MNTFSLGRSSDSVLARRWRTLPMPRWYLASWIPLESLRMKQQSLLKLLAAAHRERCDLVPLLDAFALENRGRYRRLIQRFSRQIANGIPFVTAIEQTPDLLSEEAVLALRFGSQSGTLTESYRVLLDNATKNADPTQEAFRSAFVYWAAIFFVICFLACFMFYFIFPTLDKLGRDLVDLSETGGKHFEEPFVYASLHWFRNLVLNNFFLTLFIVISVVCLLSSALVRRILRRAFTSRDVGRDSTGVSAGVLPLLAVSLRAGRPVSGSLSSLAKYHYAPGLRKKLLIARNEVEHGENEWTCLADVGILNVPEANALQNSSSNQMRAWILDQLATQRIHEAQQRRRLAFQIVQPLVILGFAAFVLWICYSVFSFLSETALHNA